MKAAVCAALGLMLVVMAEGQFAPDLPVNIINVEMYIPDLDLDQRPGLLDPTSGDHANLTSEVKKAFSEYGGDVEQVLLSDGSGCVKVFVVWNIADNSALFSLTRQLQRDGLTVFGKTWDIRFDECKPAATLPPPDTEVINFEMHVPDLDPMSRPSLMNVTSADYTELNAAIVSFFSQYGGEIEDVNVSDGGACTKIFIVWQNANRDLWFQLSQELKTVGFQAFGQMWKVNFDGSCQHVMTTPSPSVVNLEIYIPGLDLATKPDLQNANTDDYWTFRNAITSAVMPFRGFVDEVLVSDGGGCAKVYLTVTDIEDRSVFRLQEALKNKGLTVFDRSWRLNFDGCADDYSVVELKLYLVGLQWSDAYNDRSSPEYMSVASLVKERFQALGGKLMNLELGQVNGCAELMVQWEATRHAAILDVILGLTDVTVVLDNNYYKVQLRPCQPSQESTSSCPTLPPLTPCARDNCSTNAQCRSDYLCCDGCCMRVNYAVKFNASLVMDATFMPGYNTSTDVRFASLETSLTQWVRSAFTQTLSVSAGAELLGASPWFHKSRNVTRVHFSVFLEVDLGMPNLEEVADYLTVGDLAVEGTSYPILSVDIGRGGRCGRGHCPARSCNGVWKEFLSGLQYCDCVAGYHGPRCDLFDCRADISQPDSPTNSLCHSEGGQCLQQNTSSSYKCQCNMGYMGKTCETRVCDYFPDDFCSGQGQCVADMKGGNLCKCQPGRGGLFCENQQEDNLTQCQRQRRLMQYVHGIVGWNSTASVAQRETLREFFRMSNHTEYLVPACWPVNDAHQGGYHSMCNYDVRSGYSRCYCTNSEGEPNYWHYAGHMDCRIYSSGGENMTFEMYLHNVTYNRTTMSRNSAIYRSVETAARDALSNYGGRPNNITFQPHAGMCVKVTIQWLSTAAGAITADVYQSMLDWLSREPINVGRAMAYLSPRPCPMPMDEDVCPDMSREESGLVGLCAFMCSEDSECPGQLNKCCKNPCGGTNCMEVGYQQKLKTSLSTQIPYTMAVTSSADGSVSLDARLNTTLVAMVDNMMRRYRVPHYRMSRVVGFRPADDTVQRRKRQVMEPTTTIDMELLFRGEVPVKKVLEMSQMLERVHIPYMGTNYSVSAVDSGDEKNCPSKPCSSGSLCVTSLGGQRKCQCPMDKGGDYCENDVHLVEFKLYVLQLTWTRELQDPGSRRYMDWKTAVTSKLSGMGGKLVTLEFSSINSCVGMYVQWEATTDTAILSVITGLTSHPLGVAGMYYTVQTKPCPLTPTQGTGDDYVFSMSALVVIDMEFDPSILPTSPTYIMIDEIVQTEAPNAFRDVSSDVKVTARLRGLSPYRHEYMNLTALHVTAYLWKDLSYVELQKAKENLAATSFPNPGAEPLRAVHVEFGGHSGNGSFSACGNRRCNGVCKNFRTGQHVCACPTGYQGPLCDTFDCRTNMTSWPAPQVGHCQNGGMCRLDLEDSVFECECVPGYYGELCEVNVCDYMTEPCSQAGTCVGDVTSGELCRCEPGYAGLFCERRGTESLSDCEKERRLLLFAHQQVLGARQDPRLKIPMVSLLQEITSTFYTVPSCWPKDQAHDGGHHSFCEYNVTNGHQLDCFCTNVDGDRNGAHYVGHMDCRMYGTVQPVLKQGILYIPGLEYSDSLLDRASDLYKEIKEQISLILEPEVGGYLQKMFFIERAMCVRVTVNWMALERSRLKSVVTMLSGRSISLAGNTTTYSLSQKECLTAGQLDRCPRVPYDYESTLVGACEASSCRRDSDCHKGYKCCSAGCGNVTQCMIAGYLSKTQITLSTEIPFWADLYNSSSLLHRLVAYNISSLMDEVLKSKVVGYKMNKVLGFRPANSSSYRNDSYNNNNYNNNYNNSTYNNSTGGRNRRQALPATEVAVELYFISEVPVQQMLEVLEDVESSPIVIRGESYAVRRVRAGEEGPCPRDECSRGSVCAANISGNKYCACPVGRAGRRCEINECRVHQGGLACLNNGTCQFSNTYNDYRCDCP
ncbi:uncharacterized protein LOC101857554, partial [Aplysia californica]|uniref:Uncharacterized protein LOC101857554 n=1 Tax=Aplysia californica TaxID=6500 RepID=A0ABM0ZWM2_APLCA